MRGGRGSGGGLCLNPGGVGVTRSRSAERLFLGSTFDARDLRPVKEGILKMGIRDCLESRREFVKCSVVPSKFGCDFGDCLAEIKSELT